MPAKKKVFLTPRQLKEIYGVSLSALALFSFISILDLGGVVGTYFDLALRAVLGVGRYILPLALIAWALTFFVERWRLFIESTAIGLGLIFLSFISLVHLTSVRAPASENIFNPDHVRTYGGYVGATLSYLFYRPFGLVGAYVLLGAILLIGIIMAAQVSIADIAGGVYDRLRLALRHRPVKQISSSIELPARRPLGEAEGAKTTEEIPATQVIPSEAGSEGGASIKGVKDRTYQFPPLDILTLSGPKKSRFYRKSLNERIRIVEGTLSNFGVDATVSRVVKGPTVTRFEVQLGSGVKVNRLVSLSDDLAVALASPDVRILTPVPGKSVVGIEVPSEEKELVTLGDVLTSEDSKKDLAPLVVGLGKDIAGGSILAQIGDMPHLLISGATGSGKTTCINAIISSLLFFSHPEQVKMLLIDPKLVELAHYNELPHLVAPVVTNPRKAAVALSWLVKEMETRFKLLAEAAQKNIELFNQTATREERLPYVVVVIDELADLMMVAPAEVEEAICRLAQMGRAVGINLVVATQRPSVDVITGVIKANIPSRISFEVASQTDSRVILDMVGAEKLIGRGDMLYLPAGSPKPQRVQGAFITEKEIENLVAFVKDQREPEYYEELLKEDTTISRSLSYHDPLLDDALELVVRNGHASISMLQRRLRIGYSRAARLIDTLEEKGIVGGADGSKPRAVLLSEAEFERMRTREQADD